MTASGTIPRAARLSTPLPPSASLSSGGHSAASSTSSWSRNGVRASSPWAIVMLSTRLTGSSTSITSASSRSPRASEPVGGEPVGGIVVERRAEEGGDALRVAVEERAGVDVQAVAVRLEQRRVPVIAPEDLVGALAGLHHLAPARDLLGQQVERDRVVGDHRLAHRRDRPRQRGQQPL